MLKRRRGQKYFRNGSLCMPGGYLVREIAYIVQNPIILPLYTKIKVLGGIAQTKIEGDLACTFKFMHTQLIFYKYILTDSSSGKKNSLDILAPKRASARSSNFAIDFGPATRNFISILRVPKVKNVPKNRFGKFQRPSK